MYGVQKHPTHDTLKLESDLFYEDPQSKSQSISNNQYWALRFLTLFLGQNIDPIFYRGYIH